MNATKDELARLHDARFVGMLDYRHEVQVILEFGNGPEAESLILTVTKPVACEVSSGHFGDYVSTCYVCAPQEVPGYVLESFNTRFRESLSRHSQCIVLEAIGVDIIMPLGETSGYQLSRQDLP